MLVIDTSEDADVDGVLEEIQATLDEKQARVGK